MKLLRIFSVIINFVMFTSLSTAFAEEISFDAGVRYKKNEQNSFSDLKPGETLKLNAGENALVSTRQGLPLLIYSPQNKNSQIHVSSSNLNNLVQEQLQQTLEKSTNEVIDGLRRTESFLQKRNFEQALAIISPLKEKYGNISSVLFMSGTVYYLMNNKVSAIADLEKGLSIDPENQSAKKLLQQLKGSL